MGAERGLNVSGLRYPDIASDSVRVRVRVAGVRVRVERGGCPGSCPNPNPDTNPIHRIGVSGFLEVEDSEESLIGKAVAWRFGLAPEPDPGDAE
jgi:hypothetical protein